jgi:fatty-acyl-CoA synthase
MRDIAGLTVTALLDQVAAESNHPTILFPDEECSYAELAAKTRELARGLTALGVERGDKVGILQMGGIDTVAMLLATMRLGAWAVPINARYKSEELSFLAQHADLRVIVVDDVLSGVVVETVPALANHGGGPLQLDDLPELRYVLGGDDPPPGFLNRAEFAGMCETVPDEVVEAAEALNRPDDVCILLYTSGTTANPKGCMHSHSTLLHQGANMAFNRFGLSPDDTFWSPLPLFHIGGIVVLVTSIVSGARFCHPGMFEPGLAVRQLRDNNCTVGFPAFETIWLAVLDHPDFDPADMGSLRLLANIGVPERLRSMQERLPTAIQVSCTGGTESAGFISVGIATDTIDQRVNTCGFPVAGMEAKITDPETGDDLEPPAVGELCYRGVSRFLGYYKDPETTAERIDAEGFFHTGDLTEMDADGRLTFLSRIKDMLKVGGENVAAAEIEDYLARHPSVAIVQVVAAPDARYTEVAAAFVQLKQSTSATEEELIAHCLGKIATFKVPRYVRFVNDWPMSGTKVQKYKLRDNIAAELEAAGITEAPRLQSNS